MARKKKEKLDGYIDKNAYSNTDAMIGDKLLRMALYNARKSKHISQKELAKLSGLSESCISNIESGESSSPTLRSLIKYTTALGIELSVDFVSRDSKEQEQNSK
jgi:transcriptional regulator with XRE-family HTH domain